MGLKQPLIRENTNVNKFLTAIAATAIALAFAAPASARSSCDGDATAGTIVGGVVGGIIGNQFGRGSGRTAATVGGIILGGIVGNKIARDACDDDRHDAYYYNDTYSDAFDDPEEGREYQWRNPYSNHYGYVTAGEWYEDGYEDYDGPCREFTQRVWVDGRWQNAWGVACRQSDGSWRIVSGR